jgi:hypothetical protein
MTVHPSCASPSPVGLTNAATPPEPDTPALFLNQRGGLLSVKGAPDISPRSRGCRPAGRRPHRLRPAPHVRDPARARPHRPRHRRRAPWPCPPRDNARLQPTKPARRDRRAAAPRRRPLSRRATRASSSTPTLRGAVRDPQQRLQARSLPHGVAGAPASSGLESMGADGRARHKVWAPLLGLTRAIVEDVWVGDEGAVVVAVRVAWRERDRCGVCRRRSPEFDLGDAGARWTASSRPGPQRRGRHL